MRKSSSGHSLAAAGSRDGIEATLLRALNSLRGEALVKRYAKIPDRGDLTDCVLSEPNEDWGWIQTILT